MLINYKKLMTNINTLKLKGYLEKTIIRTIRYSTQKIIGGGNRLKGVIQGLVSRIKAVPLKAVTK